MVLRSRIRDAEERKAGVLWGLRPCLHSVKAFTSFTEVVRGLRVAVPIRIIGGIFTTTDAWALSRGILSLLVWKNEGIGRISRASLMILMCSQGPGPDF